MSSERSERGTQAGAEQEADAGDQLPPLPPFAEQVAQQIGGWRGLIESSIPVVAFVIANLLSSLRPAIIIAIGVAVVIAVARLLRKEPIRHAVNGVFGVAIGAVIAWRSGEARDFHLPAILYNLGYGVALLGSVALRQPLVGWIWSVVAAGGRSDWRRNPRLLRAFNWLTVAWASVYLAKGSLQWVLFEQKMDTALGITRVVLGFPPYALLLAATFWVARRIDRDAAQPVTEPAAVQAQA
jgi:hypothetical protein